MLCFAMICYALLDAPQTAHHTPHHHTPHTTPHTPHTLALSWPVPRTEQSLGCSCTLQRGLQRIASCPNVLPVSPRLPRRASFARRAVARLSQRIRSPRRWTFRVDEPPLQAPHHRAVITVGFYREPALANDTGSSRCSAKGGWARSIAPTT